MTRSLLGAADPPPFHVQNPDAASDFLIVCDHAGRAIPSGLGDLGVGHDALSTHIAFDLGVASTSRLLAGRLDAFLILQTYSRLVIDCNRWPGSADSIVLESERTAIPGNADLTAADIEAREREIFDPYHDRIRAELDRRQRAGRPTILVALHSFTPVFMDETRAWHAGVLYNHDAPFAQAVLNELRDDPQLLVGDNEPYSASEETDYAVIVHGERRGLPCVELELRHDLIGDDAAQKDWAERLAHALEASRRALDPA